MCKLLGEQIRISFMPCEAAGGCGCWSAAYNSLSCLPRFLLLQLQREDRPSQHEIEATVDLLDEHINLGDMFPRQVFSEGEAG